MVSISLTHEKLRVHVSLCVYVCVYMHMGVLQIIQLLQESQTL